MDGVNQQGQKQTAFQEGGLRREESRRLLGEGGVQSRALEHQGDLAKGKGEWPE